MNALSHSSKITLIPPSIITLLLAIPVIASTASTSTSSALTKGAEPIVEVKWRSIEDAVIEGRAWDELAEPYDRLPAKAEAIVRKPVWRLAQDSAGICARFITNASTIHARWELRSDSLEMHHMPATGVSGLDLYGRDATGAWRWVGVGKPNRLENEQRLATGLDGQEREYMLYLPLYNGVHSVQIGLDGDASFRAGAARSEARSKPIVFYGTSITQGGCASRPGMVHTAILGRRLNHPVVNLGFSGNGTMDLEFAPLLAEIDAAVYVIDCLPNMNAKQVSERAAAFVRALRAKRPRVPILLVEDRSFDSASFIAIHRNHHAASREALSAAHRQLLAEGVKDLRYLFGEGLLGSDGESTVDGSHPTDLGFMRLAAAFESTLRELLDNNK
ncbi:MAG: lysophospholipase L1-like esterase [Planctomycetota bacterium]